MLQFVATALHAIALVPAVIIAGFRRPGPFDERQWHAWSTPFFVRTLEGTLALTVWRRRGRDGKWEYMPREETGEEWLDRW